MSRKNILIGALVVLVLGIGIAVVLTSSQKGIKGASSTPSSTPSPTPSELSSPKIILPSDQILLMSPNGIHGLKFGSDGNFFTYKIATGNLYWSNYGNIYGANKLEFNNGNILITNTTIGSVVWESQTQGSGATKLVLQDDSNLVLYNNDKSISYWSSWYGKTF